MSMYKETGYKIKIYKFGIYFPFSIEGFHEETLEIQHKSHFRRDGGRRFAAPGSETYYYQGEALPNCVGAYLIKAAEAACREVWLEVYPPDEHGFLKEGIKKGVARLPMPPVEKHPHYEGVSLGWSTAQAHTFFADHLRKNGYPTDPQ